MDFYSKIYGYRTGLNNIDSKLALGNNYIKNFDNNDKIDFISKNIEDKSKNLKKLKDIKGSFKDLSLKIFETKNELKNLDENIKDCTGSYEKTILDVGVCPFCYSKIDDESIEHIKYHLRND